MGLNGIGIDIVDIDRFEKFKSKNDIFLKNNFSQLELDYCFSYKRPAEHLAGIFAAKEATYKSLNKKMLQSTIVINHDDNGRPIASLNNKELHSVLISISHGQNSAVAVAVNYES